jgi:cell division protein FtsW
MFARRLKPAVQAARPVHAADAPRRWLRHAFLAVLATLFLAQFAALLRAPQAWVPARVTIRLAPGESASLAPLGQATIGRDTAGRWFLQAEAAGPSPIRLVRGDAPAESLATISLPSDFISLPGGHRVARQPAVPSTIAFDYAGSHWRYDGSRVLRNSAPQPDCPETRWTARLVAWWNGIAPVPLTRARALTLGGNLHCGNRIGIPGTMPDAAAIAFTRGEPHITDLEQTPRTLAGVQAVILGRMRLALAQDGAGAHADVLALQPQRQVPTFSAPSIALPRHATWQWSARTLWPAAPEGAWQTAYAVALGIATLTCLAHAILTGAIAAAPHGAARNWLLLPAVAKRLVAAHGLPCLLRAVTGAVLLAAGVLSLVLQRVGQPPAAASSLLMAGLALAAWFAVPAARTAANGCAAILLGAGLFLQLELGLGGADLRYFHKTAALLAMGFGALTLWKLAPPNWRATAGNPRTAEPILLLLATVALAGLAAQVIWGDETGVFDLQPVELAKLALCSLSAHCLALRFGWHDGPQYRSALERWLALAAPVILFASLLAIALIQVDDYSPLILLLLWSWGCALAYACAAGHRKSAALLLAAAALAASGIAALQQAGASALPGSFYADRFQVWLAPGEHPHTGQQLLRAAGAIAQGGLAGADSSFGLRSAGLPAGDAIAIPAVQDDFAPSFFLNRHGLLAGMALWCLQSAFLACLLWQAWRCARWAGSARAYQQAWSARFRCFALCGGAALAAGHFLLSWGTNLAMLPVMGQPMSFLSAGGSHLLFFLLPLLGLSAASNEE